MDITHEENQKIIDNMYARGIRTYLKGTQEEIDAVERHRNASPYKVGNEPDYNVIPKRLSRRKKKEMKKWIIKIKLKLGFSNFNFSDKWVSNRHVRRTYYNLYKLYRLGKKIKSND
jgi:hypothetical protein